MVISKILYRISNNLQILEILKNLSKISVTHIPITEEQTTETSKYIKH